MVAGNLAPVLLVMPSVMAFVALFHDRRVRLFLRVQGRFCDSGRSLRHQWRTEKDNQQQDSY
jgi:hypothetical protein